MLQTLLVNLKLHFREKAQLFWLFAFPIILATMFLKQHSILDTLGACLMACILYQFVYAPQHRKVPRFAREKRTAKTSGL